MPPVSALHAVSCSQIVSACGGDYGPTHGGIYPHTEWSLARLAYVRSFRFLAVSDSPVELHCLVSSPCTPPGRGWGLGIRLRANTVSVNTRVALALKSFDL